MTDEWIPIDQVWDYDWAKAEIRRMNRTQDEADALGIMAQTQNSRSSQDSVLSLHHNRRSVMIAQSARVLRASLSAALFVGAVSSWVLGKSPVQPLDWSYISIPKDSHACDISRHGDAIAKTSDVLDRLRKHIEISRYPPHIEELLLIPDLYELGVSYWNSGDKPTFHRGARPNEDRIIFSGKGVKVEVGGEFSVSNFAVGPGSHIPGWSRARVFPNYSELPCVHTGDPNAVLCSHKDERSLSRYESPLHVRGLFVGCAPQLIGGTLQGECEPCDRDCRDSGHRSAMRFKKICEGERPRDATSGWLFLGSLPFLIWLFVWDWRRTPYNRIRRDPDSPTDNQSDRKRTDL